MSANALLVRASRSAHWVALISSVLLLLVVSRRPQGLHFYDQAMQAIALQQWQEGIAPTPNTVVRVDPADVTRNTHEWLSWWPPSLQLLALPFVSAGLSLGAALRAVFAVALVAGAVGWLRWARRFDLPAVWLLVLAICFPWLRHASENAFRYSAEILSFGLAPWLLLLALRLPGWIHAATSGALIRLVLAGLALGCGYAMKYSLFVFVLCALAFVALETREAWTHGPRRQMSLLALALLGASAAVIPIALRAINAAQGSADPVSFAGAHTFDPMDLVFAIANPALALADAQGPLFHALVFPGVLLPAAISHSLGGLDLLAWIALPAGGLLGYLLVRFWRAKSSRADLPGRLAVATLVFNTAVLLALWQFAEVDHMARHIAPAAFATLPLALREGLAAWRRDSRALKPLLALAGVVFVAGPLAYGFVYIGAKCRAVPASYRTGESGLNLPNLSLSDIPRVMAAARQHAPADAIWIVDDPEMALEVPGRFMLTYGDRTVGREMHRLQHGPWRAPGDLATSRPVTLALLLKAHGNEAENVAYARSLTDTIANARDWRLHAVPTASFVLWTARLDP